MTKNRELGEGAWTYKYFHILFPLPGGQAIVSSSETQLNVLFLRNHPISEVEFVSFGSTH